MSATLKSLTLSSWDLGLCSAFHQKLLVNDLYSTVHAPFTSFEHAATFDWNLRIISLSRGLWYVHIVISVTGGSQARFVGSI